jgi:hypothetical protein
VVRVGFAVPELPSPGFEGSVERLNLVAFQRLVLGLGMVAVATLGDVGEDLVRAAGQLAGIQIDQLVLPFDTQAGSL